MACYFLFRYGKEDEGFMEKWIQQWVAYDKKYKGIGEMLLEILTVAIRVLII